MRKMFAARLALLSPGAWVILALAASSSVAVALWRVPQRTGTDFWIFARQHLPIYQPLADQWNREHPGQPLHVSVIQFYALERRLLSGFLSGTPVADLMEVERMVVGRTFTGPPDDVGFTDLTDRLRQDGLLEKLNGPSLSPWTSHGRIYGIPHDIHPVGLAYRADIVEAAGIDMTQVETWDDFFRLLSPLMKDLDGDGRPDRYLLNFWPSPANRNLIETLVLQGGGRLFDDDGRPVLNSEANAHIVATLVTWLAGPRRMCIDAPEQTAGGDQMRANGTVLASLMPDWLAGAWENFNPALAGKVKIIPLPAWTRGGRRTSVLGGTMLGIPKTTADFEQSWRMAKYLYLSPASAEALYRNVRILTPVTSLWSLPVFHEPDPYFSGQKIGELFIRLAPDVPHRSSSAFTVPAIERLTGVLLSLRDYALQENRFTVEELRPEAHRLLDEAQREIAGEIARNVFVSQPAPAPAP
ncbi:MAG TPA: extracellular solute-binding protein [Opitutaceae bacterium]|nr:extracellular solute-binding protein [Opitutaceae bacterium]